MKLNEYSPLPTGPPDKAVQLIGPLVYTPTKNKKKNISSYLVYFFNNVLNIYNFRSWITENNNIK